MSHKCEWENCSRCPLGGEATTHVLLSKNHAKPERLDVLFIGEAPGSFESAMGLPFIGPAGKLFRKALDKVDVDRFRWAMTNTLACQPKDNAGNNRQPTEDELKACGPRVLDLVSIYNPKMIVFVGTIARDFSGPEIKARGFRGRMRNVYHPSYILRQGGEHTKKFTDYVENLKEVLSWLENDSKLHTKT